MEKNHGKLTCHHDWKLSEIVSGSHNSWAWTKALQISVNKDLYKVIQKCQNEGDMYGSKITLLSDNWLSYVGNTSYNVVTTLWEHETGALLVKSDTLGVRVDLSTRKPLKISDEVKKKFVTGENKAPDIPLVPEPPENVYTMLVTVQYGDLDFNGHVNNVVYSKYIVDCAAMAMYESFYKDLEGHLGSYMVEKVVNHFVSEAWQKDDLMCCTWQDVDDPGMLYFRITKQMDGTLVATGIMKLGPNVKTLNHDAHL